MLAEARSCCHLLFWGWISKKMIAIVAFKEEKKMVSKIGDFACGLLFSNRTEHADVQFLVEVFRASPEALLLVVLLIAYTSGNTYFVCELLWEALVKKWRRNA